MNVALADGYVPASPGECVTAAVGISYSGRTYAEGKKIGWSDGMRAVYCVLRYGLWRRITGRARRERSARMADAA